MKLQPVMTFPGALNPAIKRSREDRSNNKAALAVGMRGVYELAHVTADQGF